MLSFIFRLIWSAKIRIFVSNNKKLAIFKIFVFYIIKKIMMFL